MAKKRREKHTSEPNAQEVLPAITAWYFRCVYGRWEGPGVLPFYCDPSRVGPFAVNPEELSANQEEALFKFFVATMMFQALRDVLIVRQQFTMKPAEVKALSSLTKLRQELATSRCPQLSSAGTFEKCCSVSKRDDKVDCAELPGEACHVKEATRLFRRMGDMGKLPTSAWLRLAKVGGLVGLFETVCKQTTQPKDRAGLLVKEIAGVYRVGEKLATLFVSLLSVPALAPGLTPWFPAVDGSSLVVLDTNVNRALDYLRGGGATQTYEARVGWLREQASSINLNAFHPSVPSTSARLVQQALYYFCSKSNRTSHQDPCQQGESCLCLSKGLCPFQK